MTTDQTGQIDALLDGLAALTEEDVALLAGAWEEEDDATRRRAWATAKGHMRRAKTERLMDQARNDVGRWAAASRADYQGIAGLLGQPTHEANVRLRAAPAVLDAVAAILAADALDEDERLVLARPLESVAGRDAGRDAGRGDTAR